MSVLKIDLVAGGGSVTLDNRALYTNVLLTGNVTLTGSHTIGAPSTPFLGQEFKIRYSATIVPSGNTVTIFGWVVPDNLLDKKFVLHTFYNGTSWDLNLMLDLSTNGILDGAKIQSSTIAIATAIADGTILPIKLENDTIDGRMLLSQNAGAWQKKAMSGDGSIDKDGVFTLANASVTAEKLATTLGTVQIATRTLDQSAIQSLNTAPAEIVANPGANKVLIPLGMIARLNPDGVAFAGAVGDLELMHETSSGALMEIGGNFLKTGTTKVGIGQNVSFDGTEGVVIAANGLYLKSKSNDMTAGGASAELKVTIAYLVVDFT